MLNLRFCNEIQLPSNDVCHRNNVIQSESQDWPKLIEQLEEESGCKRLLQPDTGTQCLSDSLKHHMHEIAAFSEYFADSRDGSEACLVLHSEIVQYLEVFIDDHISDICAYRDKAEAHIYSLLQKITPLQNEKCSLLLSGGTWPISLVMKASEEGDRLSKYNPWSNFFITINGFPHLLLEVGLDREKKRDHLQMLLQASCLVCLGNALLQCKTPSFFIKTIYIDHDYVAVEHTLYQKLSASNDKVLWFLCLLTDGKKG
ncbi:hypothetical protein EI94DRAFT_1703549 [Lactarius quietus]|nr:hypothetical protein EI94DRAFT_1703549 [Lactarius quietus]